MTSRAHFQVPLAGGRRLALAEYGAPDGMPLMYMHGIPGSRLDLQLPGIPEALAERGIRALAVDRPGIGESSFVPKRSVVAWVDDVSAVADQLGLDRFAVLGVSGGGPYALACAARLASRITGVGIVGGLGPSPGPGWRDVAGGGRLVRLATRLPPLRRWIVRRAVWLLQARGARVVDRVLRRLPEADRQVLRNPSVRNALVATWTEAARQGPQAIAQELDVAVRRWGFALSAVRVPVQLWFGGADRTVPAAMGFHLAATLPRATARHLPGEGHFSLVVNRAGDILDRLVEQQARGWISGPTSRL